MEDDKEYRKLVEDAERLEKLRILRGRMHRESMKQWRAKKKYKKLLIQTQQLLKELN